MFWICRSGLGAAGAVVVAVVAGTASANSIADFYKGKNVVLIVGTGAGGGYDGYARLLARHIVKNIPGKPTIVVQNMPGASGIRAANYLYSVAPQDGSVLATFNQSMPIYQLLGRKGIKFDVKDFNFIGGMSKSNSLVVTWHTTGVKSIEDAKEKTVVMAASGAGGTSFLFPTLLNNTLGTKFDVVTGYTGGQAMNLALERGEAEGRGSTLWTSWKSGYGEWLRQKKINFILQIGLEKEPELSHVPLLLDQAKNETERRLFEIFSSDVALGRPFLTTPAVPANRVAALRDAFDATMKDSAFGADARKQRLEVNPTPGRVLQQIVERVATAPAEIVTLARAAVSAKGKGAICAERSRDITLCRAAKKRGAK